MPPPVSPPAHCLLLRDTRSLHSDEHTTSSSSMCEHHSPSVRPPQTESRISHDPLSFLYFFISLCTAVFFSCFFVLASACLFVCSSSSVVRFPALLRVPLLAFFLCISIGLLLL